MIEQYDLSFLDLNQILKVIHTRSTDIHGLVENGISSYNVGMPILEHSQLNGLHKIIKKYINVYREKYNISALKIINSWFNITNPGGELVRHKHEESIISGAFYVNVGENAVPLIFPNLSLKPRNGLLVIFSSQLEHYTIPEVSYRTTISFNTEYL